MSDGKIQKMEEDFAPVVDKKLPEFQEQAKSGKLNDALENLLALEKQTRQAVDVISTTRIAKCIVNLCFEAKDYKNLEEKLTLLSKRRGQLKTAIQGMVQEAMTFLEKMDKESKNSLITTLRTITEGKMFVEIERARLTRILAKIKEEEGKISEAASILQEVQVETFGQMDKFEKTEYILEQVRLCLEKGDFIRAQILSNKLRRKALEDKEMQELKLKYYELMIRYYAHDQQHLEICRCYQAIYDTEIIKEDEAKWGLNLQMIVVYCCLSPRDNEQSDLLHRIQTDKNLDKVVAYKNLLKFFSTEELMRWPLLKEMYSNEFAKLDIFSSQEDEKTNYWDVFHNRVVEHNIRVIAKYYSRIRSDRLCQLLDLTPEETEKQVSDLVVSKSIYARIDRPNGIITFQKKKDPSEVLDSWSSNIGGLLELLEKTHQSMNKIMSVA